MFTSPHLNEERPRANNATVAAFERCPFLEEAGEAQARVLPLKRTLSSWPTESDARAGDVLAAFARSGGVADCNEIMLMLRRRTSQPISMLGRWIVEQRVVSFEWRGDLVLPLFQFDRADMGVRVPVTAVLGELDGAFDDWELATWFALPNAWLDDRAPLDAIDDDPEAVRQAARADRFIARG